MKKLLRYTLWTSLVGLLVIAAIVLGCNYCVVQYARHRSFSEVDSVPSTGVGLLLGTTPQTRIGKEQNLFFTYRLDAAEALYRAGKINLIFISGDKNSLDGVNEPQCMRDSLVARGIPENVFFQDGKGYSTIESVVRINQEYGIRSFTIISQRFHNERALYLAGHLGLDVQQVQAFDAKAPTSGMAFLTYIREYFARVKMFIDIATHDKSKHRKTEVSMSQPSVAPIDELEIENFMEEQDTFGHDINTIDAHDEQDTIVGNFTGQGMDTLFVETIYKDELGTEESVEYFMRSTNRRIPKLRLYGCLAASPKLVNEGDLDGNGTCEVGYLHTWMTSQWRYYRIFTLVNNEWRYLVKGDYLDTSEWFRHAGVEVAEPGKTKGTILIHYPYEGYDPQKDSWVNDVRDTIVTPTFSKIDDL